MDVIDLSLQLNEALRESSLFQQLKQAEQRMLDSDEVKQLIIFYQTAQNNYNEAVRLHLSHLPSVQADLATAKQRLDTHPFVLTYQKYFRQMKEILRDINHQLFDEFQTPASGGACRT